MDVVATVRAEVPLVQVHAVVADLSSYPRWLDIVVRAEEVERLASDPGPAWSVDLRAQLGPLRRSKRLRMVRTVDEADRVVFERRESGARQHSPWILRAHLDEHRTARDAVRDGNGEPAVSTELRMELHYGGSLWLPMLDRLLAEEISRSRPRLLDELGVAG